MSTISDRKPVFESVAQSDQGSPLTSTDASAPFNYPANNQATAYNFLTDALNTGAASNVDRTMTTQTVTFQGSGVVFNNTYGGGVTQAYKSCVLSAEQTIASTWDSSVTINVEFDAQAAGQTGWLASNSFYTVNVTYSALKSALTSLASTEGNNTYLQQAVAHLPSTDPSGGAGFDLPLPYARLLGLSSSSQNPEDIVTLNTSYNWSYGQDVINALEHEISEGSMGRIGGLGDDNSIWSTMDLFRYNSSGQPDYTDGRDGRTTYFSYNGGSALSSLSFNNEYSGGTQVNGNDTADFTQLDVFGTGQPGETNTLSQTDIQIMDALGWDPGAAPPSPSLTDIVGVADFSGDGKADLMYEDSNNQFWEALSTGSGFATPQIWGGEGGPNNSWEAQFADLNHDGKADLVYQGADNRFWVSLSNGSSFGPAQLWATMPGKAYPGSVHLEDVNGDGKADLIYEDTNNAFWVALSTGTGFSAPQQWGGEGGPNNAWEAQFADLNGDGKMDLVYQGVDNRFWVSLSNVSGFGPAQLWASEGGPSYAGGAQYADVNGDGKADLIYEGVDNRFWVSLSTGNGFAGAQLWGSEGGPNNPWEAQYADVTGSGKADLVYQGVDNRIWVSLSTGNGFGPAQLWATLPGTAYAGSLHLADVNGDGKADLIYEATDGTIYVGLSNGSSFGTPQVWNQQNSVQAISMMAGPSLESSPASTITAMDSSDTFPNYEQLAAAGAFSTGPPPASSVRDPLHSGLSGTYVLADYNFVRSGSPDTQISHSIANSGPAFNGLSGGESEVAGPVPTPTIISAGVHHT